MSRLILPLHLTRGGLPIIGSAVSAQRDVPRDPDPPESVVRELQREDPRWFLRFSRYPKPHWDVCERWRGNDPKRARIKSGELPPDADYDVICFCPPDILAADVVGYVRQRLVRIESAAKQAAVEQAAIEQSNKATREKRANEFRSEVEHSIKTTTPHERLLSVGATTAHTMIQGADLT